MKETLKMALEVLVCLKKDFDADQFEWEIADEAITAIKEALAQPEHEPQRKPLTNEEIYKIYRDCGDLNVKINIARAIEAAHGIKEKNV
jgi:hypothetical protein